MFPSFVAPYLIGLVTAPLVLRVVKPLFRNATKTTIEIGLKARKLAAEAIEDLQDLAAEANADVAAAEIAKRPGGFATGSKKG